MLINHLNLERNLSRNPLFDVIFALQNISLTDHLTGDLQLTPYSVENPTVKFDLTLNVSEAKDELYCSLQYRSNLFKPETMLRFKDHLLTVLAEIVAFPDRFLKDLTIISSAERDQILYDFNNTKTEDLPQMTFQQLFQAQVAKTPEKVALVYAGQRLTYQELNNRSNQWARRLCLEGIGRQDVVGVLAKPSLEMIIGVLAVLKAGAAYLPLDFQYPKERIDFMLNETQCKILLTEKALSEIFTSTNEDELLHFSEKILFLNEPICAEVSELTHINSPAKFVPISFQQSKLRWVVRMNLSL